LRILGSLGVLVVLGKVISFTRDAILASRLGTSEIMASFVVVFGLQTALVLVISEALSVGSVKTMLSKAINQDAILGAGLILGAGFAAVQFLGATLLASVLTNDSPLSVEVATALRWTAPSSGAFILMGAVAGVLYAREKLRAAVGLTAFWAAGALLAAAFVPSPRLAVYGGWSASTVAIAAGALVLNVSNPRSLWPTRSAMLGPLTIAAPTALANILFNCSFLIERKAAAALGANAVAAIGYSYKVASLPVSIYLGAITAWVLPRFIKSADKGAEFSRKVRSAVGVSLTVMGASTLIMLIAGPILVEMLFERGQFSTADSALTAAALRGYAFSLPAITGYMILVRAAQALGRYSAVILTSALGLLTTAGTVGILRSAQGLLGITAATSLGNIVCFLTLATILTFRKVQADAASPADQLAPSDVLGQGAL
jgi:peptidoglycan biosynthesis protein MviN/MurJ (putative lipid II flippase)